MPIPKPFKGEEQSHFISRCISFETKASPGRPKDQIAAMCYTAWRNRGTKGQRGGDRGGPRNRPLRTDKGDVKQEGKFGMQKSTDIVNMTMVNLENAQIDRESNVIRHVAILGTNAYDTNGNVFRKFTDKAMDDATIIFNGALARIDHDRANANTEESRGVRAGYGVYQNIRRENGKVFGDLFLWDCPDARKVMSIAERTPNAVGNSIHAGGIIREDDDGIEIVEQLLPRTKYGFKPSIDMVEDPAALIGIYQNRKLAKSKEQNMEFKDLTHESIRTNRPDLEKLFYDEGAASRDEEVKKLIQERDDAIKKCDELEVKQARIEREALVDQALAKSELPDYAKTDIFRRQLLGVKEFKDGDKTVSIEDGIKALIQDRIETLEPNGVHGNTEKDLRLNKKKTGVSEDEFIEAFGGGSIFS